MKQVYDDIPLQPGATKHGIVDMKIIPRDWLASDIVIDFATGKITTALNLNADAHWIALHFTPGSYDFEEKPKSNKSGDYYEFTAGGNLNALTAAAQMVLETVRYHELVVWCKDKAGNQKIIGNINNGCILTISHKHNSTSQVPEIKLAMDIENLSPFYESADAVIGRPALATEDGDILLTEDGDAITIE